MRSSTPRTQDKTKAPQSPLQDILVCFQPYHLQMFLQRLRQLQYTLEHISWQWHKIDDRCLGRLGVGDEG